MIETLIIVGTWNTVPVGLITGEFLAVSSLSSVVTALSFNERDGNDNKN